MFVRAIRIACVVVLAVAVFSAPSGATIWNVSTSSAFDYATASLAVGDTVICAPGDYYPSHACYIDKASVTLRGSTGNRDDIRIHGAGMNVNGGSLNNLIHLAASGITVKDLTVQDVNQNGIQIHGENGITSANIINVHTLNIGERHIKGSGRYIDSNVLVSSCLMDQTIPRSGYTGSGLGLDYIGGIDTMGASNWTIRNNVARNIQGPTGGGRGAIFVWDGSNNTIENNTIVGCDRGICLGNPSATLGPDRSIVRNNFIVRGAGIGLEICFTASDQIYNNTIYSANAAYSRTVALYGAQTNLLATNNLIRGDVALQSGGTWTATNNIIDNTGATITSAWFFNATGGDLHLTGSAGAAVGTGSQQLKVPFDFDGQLRGPFPDLGADQRTVWLAGDANGDRVVDVRDLAILAFNYNAVSGKYWSQGDFTGDTGTNVQDLAVLAFNYNQTMPPGVLVPEPACLALLPLLCLLRGRWYHRRPARACRVGTTGVPPVPVATS